MRKYGGLILVSSLLLAPSKSSAVVQPPIPVLQLATGTLVKQSDKTIIGTSLLVNLMLPDGSAVTKNTPVTIIGPPGWNQDEPLVLTVGARQHNFSFATDTIAPVAGVYKALVTIAGQTYTATSSPIDPTSVLKSAEPVTVTDDGTQVTVSWSPVDGAANYVHHVSPTRASAPGEWIAAVAATYISTRTTSVTFPSSALAPDTSYKITVLAFNTVVDSQKSMNVPTQFNASQAYVVQPFFRKP